MAALELHAGQIEMSFKTKQELEPLLEGFVNNPSNRNKYRTSLYAFIEDLLNEGMSELKETII